MRPEPPAVPISALRGLRLLRRDPIALFERAAALGDVVRIPMPRISLYLLNHPDLAWDVLSTEHHAFRKSPVIQRARRVLGESLLTSEGEHHRRQRRLIQPIFHHDRIERYGETMVAEAERAAARWGPDASFDVHAEMMRITLAVVGRALFATDIEASEARAVSSALAEVLSQFDRQFSPWFPISERLPIPSNRRLREAVEIFDRAVRAMIDERRHSGPTGDDVLSLLLAAQEDGACMSDRQVRDEALTLLLAGHETTSVALTWTWWLLSLHPEVEDRLHEELDDELGDRQLEVADLRRLNYTEAVLSESMRLRPPAWAISRQAVEDLEVDGRTLRAGSVVVVSPWLLNHDQRWWSDPLAFRPERWFEKDPRRPRHTFLPFGGGPRMCIGEGFAWMEARLMIAAIARRWRLELDPAARVELQPVITLRPRHGMPMRAVPQKAPPSARREVIPPGSSPSAPRTQRR